MTQGSLAEKLRVLRAREGLGLTEASDRIGINRHTLRELELGKREPYYPTLRKIAEGYGVGMDALVDPKASVPPSPPPAEERASGEEERRRNRVGESLRALPFENRVALLELMADLEEPWEPGRTTPLVRALEELEEPVDIAPEDFFRFVLEADAEEAREVLLAGADTEVQRRRAGAAYLAALSGLIRAGLIATRDVADRLTVAGRLQGGVA